MIKIHKDRQEHSQAAWLLFVLSMQADTAVSRPRGHFLKGQAHRGLGCGKGQFWHKDCRGPDWT